MINLTAKQHYLNIYNLLGERVYCANKVCLVWDHSEWHLHQYVDLTLLLSCLFQVLSSKPLIRFNGKQGVRQTKTLSCLLSLFFFFLLSFIRPISQPKEFVNCCLPFSFVSAAMHSLLLAHSNLTFQQNPWTKTSMTHFLGRLYQSTAMWPFPLLFSAGF